MKLYDYIQKTDLNSKIQTTKAKLLCFYYFTERKKSVFTIPDIIEFFEDAGLSKPNSSRIKNNLIKEKVLKLKKGSKKDFVFIPTTLSALQSELGNLFDSEEVISNSELLDEKKFCGKRKYLTSLVKQINSSYSNNCFDACAVLMRRLFEICLIKTYEKLGIESEIKDANNSYKLLNSIIKDAVNNRTLNLSRIKNEYHKIQKVGNFSAHRIEYIASKRDIDDIKIIYRTSIEELLMKSDLF